MIVGDIIESATVPEWQRLFVIGSFDTRITFYSQQVRAFNLVDALVSSGNLDNRGEFAVVGAGAAGLATSAALALLLPNAKVDIFESEADLLHLQRGCSRRNLHPHIYDWPKPGASRSDADLPILNWTMRSAAEITIIITSEFKSMQAKLGDRPVLRPLQTVTSIEKCRDAYIIRYQNQPYSQPDSRAYHAVFLAIGFGFERRFSGAPFHSYWSDEGVPGDAKLGRRTTRLVSGAGDGGLIDFAAAALQDFDHHELIQRLTNYPAIEEISEPLLAIDREAQDEDPDFDFMTAYDRDIRPWAHKVGLMDVIREGLRPRQNLIFNTEREQPLRQPTAILNRLLTYLLLRVGEGKGSHLEHLPGRVVAVNSAPYCYSIGGREVKADAIFVRHGPDTEAAFAPFKEIRDAYQPKHKRWLKENPARSDPPELTEEARANLQKALTDRGIADHAPKHLAAKDSVSGTEAPRAASELVLRVCALPIGLRRPRPVNLLMTIGVSRRPSIALTVGVDGAALLRDLRLVEEMIKACSGERFASRAWALSDDPAWPSQAGARGLVWRVGSATLKRTDLARSLAEAFQRPAPDCGDTLVLTMPAGAESRASELVEWIQGCGRQPPHDSAPGAIPIYAWSRDRIGKGASFGEAPDPTVERLLQCLATFSSAEHNVRVRDAYAMRVHAAASPPPQWGNADGETLRIHDLSLLTAEQADSPDLLEADRAAAIIPQAAGNSNILYALAFLPVHAGVLRALAEAPRLTRAVAGLITPEEARTPRPSWSINKVAGYRPTQAGSFTLLKTD